MYIHRIYRYLLTVACLLCTVEVGSAQTNFSRISDAAPVTDLISGAGCAWVDYDGDGYVDLFVADLDFTNHLYHNQKDGTFLAVTNGVIVTDGADKKYGNESYGAAWGDFNNDGFPDLFLGNGYPDGNTNLLYENNGDGTFTRI